MAELIDGSELKLKEHEAARRLSRDGLDSVDWLQKEVDVVSVIKTDLEVG